jgi:hypothetical protein
MEVTDDFFNTSSNCPSDDNIVRQAGTAKKEEAGGNIWVR